MEGGSYKLEGGSDWWNPADWSADVKHGIGTALDAVGGLLMAYGGNEAGAASEAETAERDAAAAARETGPTAPVGNQEPPPPYSRFNPDDPPPYSSDPPPYSSEVPRARVTRRGTSISVDNDAATDLQNRGYSRLPDSNPPPYSAADRLQRQGYNRLSDPPPYSAADRLQSQGYNRLSDPPPYSADAPPPYERPLKPVSQDLRTSQAADSTVEDRTDPKTLKARAGKYGKQLSKKAADALADKTGNEDFRFKPGETQGQYNKRTGRKAYRTFAALGLIEGGQQLKEAAQTQTLTDDMEEGRKVTACMNDMNALSNCKAVLERNNINPSDTPAARERQSRDAALAADWQRTRDRAENPYLN